MVMSTPEEGREGVAVALVRSSVGVGSTARLELVVGVCEAAFWPAKPCPWPPTSEAPGRFAEQVEAGLLQRLLQIAGLAARIGGGVGIVEGQAGGDLAGGVDLHPDIDVAKASRIEGDVEAGPTCR